MSLTVLMIGAAHAIPPIVCAVTTKSKVGVIVGAVIGCVIAFASGNPAFVGADLLGVGVGTWLGFSIAGAECK